MSIKYIAFDVETPNHLNDRISSIGVSTIDDVGLIQTKEYIVNPECDFDAFNISLTGITPSMVENAPTFPDVWAEIEPLFKNYTLVAHNAIFDLCVLQKVLWTYNLSTPGLQYLCTLKITQSVLPNLENHKLSTICSFYHIPLNHHHSGSDSEACIRIIESIEKSGVDLRKYLHYFDCAELRKEHGTYKKHRYTSESTSALNELNSILAAISCDGVLSSEEIAFLVQWMNDNHYLKGNYPYDRVYMKLEEVLEDGIITRQEHDELLCLFKSVYDPVQAAECSCSSIGLCGKNVCLSGEFESGSKESVSDRLASLGAIMQTSVTKKTNILVVGGHGSSAWSQGNYGTKIKKALELQAKGVEILIIRESDFFSAIEV